MSNRCEDYPCCGHTDNDPCGPQWYDKPGAFDTTISGNEHALCDHENGDCDVEPDEDEDEDDFDWIRYEQQGQLDQFEADYGIEPRGWEDSY